MESTKAKRQAKVKKLCQYVIPSEDFPGCLDCQHPGMLDCRYDDCLDSCCSDCKHKKICGETCELVIDKNL